MSDKRRKAELKDVKKAIVMILRIKPLQAKDLKKELKKQNISYEHAQLNNILNQMANEGDIKRTLLDNNPYPVYQVEPKSKILAQIEGIAFQTYFKTLMIKNNEELLKEFGEDKNVVDAMIKFFGFYVLGSLIVSRSSKYITQRNEWLSMVLSLEKSIPLSPIFDKLFPGDKTIEAMIKILKHDYTKNMNNLGQVCMKYKKSYIELKKMDWSKDQPDFVDNWLNKPQNPI